MCQSKYWPLFNVSCGWNRTAINVVTGRILEPLVGCPLHGLQQLVVVSIVEAAVHMIERRSTKKYTLRTICDK